MQEKQIIFITKRSHSIKKSGISVTDNVELLYKEAKQANEIAFDREFNSLIPQYATPLLSQYYFGGSNVYVVDDTSIDLCPFFEANKHKLFIGHNIEIDYRITKWHNKVPLRNLYDTVLVERELRKGMKHPNDFANVLLRRLGIEMDKSARERFIELTETSTFIDQDIVYAANDVVFLFELKAEQEKLIKKFKLEHLLDIRFKMIPILSDASLEGIELIDTPDHFNYQGYSWKENIDNLEREAEEIKIQIDKQLLEINENGGIFAQSLQDIKPRLTKPRIRQKSYQTDLFGSPIINKNNNIANINYSSTTQLIQIFHLMGLPIPTIKKKDSKTGSKVIKESMAEDALELYKIEQEHLGDEVINFIDLLIKLKEKEKAISSFGERFIHSDFKIKGKKAKAGYRNRVTGKIHTIYSQATTQTGRLTSGREADGFFNSQQIPKKAEYRHCFGTDKGYIITTADLAGAELVIAASLSRDPRLIELVKSEDVHSPLASVGFTAIIKEILKLPANDRRKKEELNELLKVNKNFFKNCDDAKAEEMTTERVEKAFKLGKIDVVKSLHNDLRDKYKAVNYGLAYGAGAERLKEIMNINDLYADVLEKAMREELPMLFDYLDNKAKEGLEQGFIIFNNRTNSRHWFKEIIDARKYHTELSFGTEKAIERSCKNYPIQGTQADMIEEATVRFFYEYVYVNNYEVTLLLQVHDENAIKHKEEEPEHGKMLAWYMTDTANLYLAGGIEMKCEPMTLKTWTK